MLFRFFRACLAVRGGSADALEKTVDGKPKAAKRAKKRPPPDLEAAVLGRALSVDYSQAYPRAMLLSSAGFRTVLIWEPSPSLRYASAMPS